MSMKRQAGSRLHQENWDADDPKDHEDMGRFQTAPKEDIEKRVIRTAKRRTRTGLTDQAKESVFSGFTDFNKAKPASFDFLSKLVNGAQNTSTNGSASGSGVFANSPFTSTFSTSTAATNTGPFSNTMTTSTSSTFARLQTSVFGNIVKPEGETTIPESKPFNVSSSPANTNQSTLFSTTFGSNSNVLPTETDKSATSSLFGTFTNSSVNAGATNKANVLATETDKPAASSLFGTFTNTSVDSGATNKANVLPTETDKPAASSLFGTFTNMSGNSGATNKANVPTETDKPVASSLFGTFTNMSGNSGATNKANIPTETDKPVASSLFGTFTNSSVNSGATDKVTTSSVFGSLNTTNNFASKPETSLPSQPASVFGIPNITGNSPFTNNTKSPAPSSNQSESKTIFGDINNKPTDFTPEGTKDENKSDTSKADKKKVYCSKLRGLNEAVLEWIQKHVERQPVCILSPIFKDYEKYLATIQEDYCSSLVEDEDNSNPDIADTNEVETEPNNVNKNTDNVVNQSTLPVSGNNSFIAKPTTENKEKDQSSTTIGSPFSNKDLSSTQTSNIFASPFNKTASENNTGVSPKFSFGINTSSTTTLNNSGFSFGITQSPSTATTGTPTFSFKPNTAAVTTASPMVPGQFSFGSGSPFSFGNNIQKPESTENADDKYEPPKVEFTPLTEENSLFEKKCKVFVKKELNFIDKGVGTLYIKKVDDSNKHQLLVRANTNLGTVLVNLILISGIPIQRMGKNNVMMVCIPTPDAKPPPTPILIRVKTSEEADELLETLNKYKS